MKQLLHLLLGHFFTIAIFIFYQVELFCIIIRRHFSLKILSSATPAKSFLDTYSNMLCSIPELLLRLQYGQHIYESKHPVLVMVDIITAAHPPMLPFGDHDDHVLCPAVDERFANDLVVV